MDILSKVKTRPIAKKGGGEGATSGDDIRGADAVDGGPADGAAGSGDADLPFPRPLRSDGDDDVVAGVHQASSNRPKPTTRPDADAVGDSARHGEDSEGG